MPALYPSEPRHPTECHDNDDKDGRPLKKHTGVAEYMHNSKAFQFQGELINHT